MQRLQTPPCSYSSDSQWGSRITGPSEPLVKLNKQRSWLVVELVITEIALNGVLMRNYFQADASILRSLLSSYVRGSRPRQCASSLPTSVTANGSDRIPKYIWCTRHFKICIRDW
jgi:hypothetical protein